MAYTNDPTTYLTIPTRTAGMTVSLAQALLAVAPKQAPPAVDKRIERIRAKDLVLRQIWTATSSKASEADTRSADTSLDRCWSTSRARISSWIEIDDEDHREAAEHLTAVLFPTGLDFLRLPFRSQWAESERRLALLDEDAKLNEVFEDLVDPRIAARLREAHETYGRVLDITEAPEAPSLGRVIDAIADLRTELVGYARLLVGLTDDDDPEAVAATERCLEPILRYRQSNSRGPASPDSDDFDEDDAPEPDELDDAPELSL